MTCIGTSGPLTPEVSEAIAERGVAVAAVLSGNRNFDGRIHNDVRLNYLASPPLVVAYALAGSMDVDLLIEPLGADRSGDPVFLSDLWPSDAEIEAVIRASLEPRDVHSRATPMCSAAKSAGRSCPAGEAPPSTGIRSPPTSADRPFSTTSPGPTGCR